ncbi:MAG: hypothetical protein ABL886_14030 [Rhodoglobus sp.]
MPDMARLGKLDTRCRTTSDERQLGTSFAQQMIPHLQRGEEWRGGDRQEN